MIGYLKGTIIEKRGEEVWLNVGGVGYRVRMTRRLATRDSRLATAELFIHTAVREDAITLYGFETMEELAFFEMLLTVSGIGPKTAMTIVGAQKVERVEKAIREADVNFFKAVPGIGKKGAQRIIVDLKGKIGSLKDLDLGDEGEDDVQLALLQFGFKREDIWAALKDIDSNLSVSERVREGLKRLGRK